MRRSRIGLAAALAVCCCGYLQTASGQSPHVSHATYQPPSHHVAPIGSAYVQTDPYANGLPAVAQVACCDCGEAACGCEISMPGCGCESSCDGSCQTVPWTQPWEGEPDCGCGGPCDGGCGIQPGCGMELGCSCAQCSEGPSSGLFDGGCLSGGCSIGDPYSILGECCGYKAGGWIQLGYHSKNLPLFNSRKNNYQLQQAWLYGEKEVDTTCGFGIGGRFDYVYGTDGPDTQAFGIPNGHWDNRWDNGRDYGHAIPQAYLEAGYGDFRVKVGHFFTIIGYEVVAAPDNFFYSHAYTMYNSEPFTHTGALGTYSMTDDLEVYGGYVLGWDSGFEDNGDAFLGGSSANLTEDITVTSTMIGGRFADNAGGDERGYMASTVATVKLTDHLRYIFQSDWLDTENASGQTVRDTVGINQYLIRDANACWSYGARFEWWSVEADSQGFYGDNAPAGLASVATGDYDLYALTLGLNYKPHANIVIRPEIRWDWVDGSTTNLAIADIELLENNEDRQTTFGVDTIFQY